MCHNIAVEIAYKGIPNSSCEETEMAHTQHLWLHSRKLGIQYIYEVLLIKRGGIWTDSPTPSQIKVAIEAMNIVDELT
jgi:hypothetical protein